MLRNKLQPFTPQRFVFQLHDVGAVSVPTEDAELRSLFGFGEGSMQHNFFVKPNKKETRIVGVLAEAKDVVDLASPKVVATAFGVVRRKSLEIWHVGVRKAHPVNDSGKGERWGVQGIEPRKKGSKTDWVHASGAKLNKANVGKLLVGSPNPYAASCLASLIEAAEATYASQRVDMACAHLFSSQYDHAAHPAIYLVYRALDFDFVPNQEAMDWTDARRPAKESVSRMLALMAEGRPVVDPRPPAPLPSPAKPTPPSKPTPPAKPTPPSKSPDSAAPSPASSPRSPQPSSSARVPQEAPPLQVASVPRVDGQPRDKRLQLFKKSLRLLEVATGAIVQVVKAPDLARIKKGVAGDPSEMDAVAAAVRTLDRRLRGCDDGFKLKPSVDALLPRHAEDKRSGACLLLAWRLPASGRDDAELVGAATLANLAAFEQLHTEPAQYTTPARVRNELAPLIDKGALWLDAICAKNSGVRRLLLLHAYQRSLSRGGLATMAPPAVQAAAGELGFQTLLPRAKLRDEVAHKPAEVALLHKPPDAKGVYALAATGLGVCARRGLSAATQERLVWRC